MFLRAADRLRFKERKMSDDKPTPVDYRVTKTREIAGQYRKEGAIIALLPIQAKYYLAPNGEGLELAKTKAASKPAKDKSSS